jgi:transcriptional regulator with XRE-family HTH domain
MSKEVTEKKSAENKDPRKLRDEYRRAISRRVQQLRLGLPEKERQLGTFADKVGLSESLLSRIESGKVSLPLDAVELIADVAGCQPEVITTGRIYVEGQKLPLQPAVEFLQQAQDLGVDGLFRDRAAALGYLVPFVNKMRGGKIFITSSSLRGLEQRSEHRFIRRLVELGGNPRLEMKVIMTHPKLGSKREHQEHRPEGSIVREILIGINWCLEVLHIEPANIRLSIASPSSFSIFLIDESEGQGIINPYPTMRQAFLSYTLAVCKVPADRGGGEAVSIFETYLGANFLEPWNDPNVTTELKSGLEECLDCIKNESEEGKDLKTHRDMLNLTLEKCEKIKADLEEKRKGTGKGRASDDTKHVPAS